MLLLGGVYGFTRGLVGPFAGFLVGIFEFCGNVTLLGIFAIAFGQSLITSLGLHDIFILPFVIIPLGVAAILQYCGTEKFFFVVKLLTVISLVLFAIYVVGGLINISVPRYGNNPNAHSPSDTYKLRQVFQNSNYGAAFFAGIETLPVVSSDAKKVTYFNVAFCKSSFFIIFNFGVFSLFIASCVHSLEPLSCKCILLYFFYCRYSHCNLAVSGYSRSSTSNITIELWICKHIWN